LFNNKSDQNRFEKSENIKNDNGKDRIVSEKEKTSEVQIENMSITSIPKTAYKYTNEHTSLFDDQGCIILKPTSYSASENINTKKGDQKKLEISTSNENLMDIDKEESKSKADIEQSSTDSTFGLKTYNSAEFSTDASYKKVVESVEDSNNSFISEISSINNEDTLELSSSVASSNVKRIIERLEKNTINNELSSSNNINGEKDIKFTKPQDKPEISQKPSFVIIEKKSTELNEVKNVSLIDNNDAIEKKTENISKEDKPISSEQEKKIDNIEKKINEDKIVVDNKKESIDKPSVDNKMDVDAEGIEKDITVNDTKVEKDTKETVVSSVSESEKPLIDAMNVDEKPNNVIIEGNVEDKIKLFEQNSIKNTSPSIELNKKTVNEDKAQEVKMDIDNKPEIKEVKMDIDKKPEIKEVKMDIDKKSEVKEVNTNIEKKTEIKEEIKNNSLNANKTPSTEMSNVVKSVSSPIKSNIEEKKVESAVEKKEEKTEVKEDKPVENKTDVSKGENKQDNSADKSQKEELPKKDDQLEKPKDVELEKNTNNENIQQKPIEEKPEENISTIKS